MNNVGQVLVRLGRAAEAVPLFISQMSTWTNVRTSAVSLSRDALPQSRHGRPVARASLRPGDLIFYATNGLVHHVTMYAGRGRMVEAPHTGAVVRTVPVRGFEYFGARRYL